MQGRAFLHVANDAVRGTTEAYWRAAVIHAYYALFLECRDALTRWGITIPPHQNVHSAVRLRFLYAGDPDLHAIGLGLDKWCKHRNHASYNLANLRKFTTDALARDAITEATATLAVLDAIDSDPVRRAAAIASFPP